jgi:hypothetical protein
MALKTGIASLVLGTLLFGSTAALAEEGSVRDWANQEAARRTNGGNNNHRDDDRRDRHDDRRDRDDRGHDRGHGGGNGYVEVHVHGSACRHGPEPRPPPRAPRGRYELQTVNRYVEGRRERVWVPEVCEERHRRRSRVTKCTGGYYDERWVPARYEQVQEWVWVPYGHHGGWSGNRAHAATYHP